MESWRLVGGRLEGGRQLRDSEESSGQSRLTGGEPQREQLAHSCGAWPALMGMAAGRRPQAGQQAGDLTRRGSAHHGARGQHVDSLRLHVCRVVHLGEKRAEKWGKERGAEGGRGEGGKWWWRRGRPTGPGRQLRSMGVPPAASHSSVGNGTPEPRPCAPQAPDARWSERGVHGRTAS